MRDSCLEAFARQKLQFFGHTTCHSEFVSANTVKDKRTAKQRETEEHMDYRHHDMDRSTGGGSSGNCRGFTLTDLRHTRTTLTALLDTAREELFTSE